MSINEDFNYSSQAKITKFYLNEDVGSIHIFTEDLNSEYKYEKIFQILMKENRYLISGKNIYSVGSKNEVFTAYNEIGKEREGKKCFYLVDGDFDRILNKDESEIDCLSYLNKYNIETYLIKESSIFRYIQPLMCDIEEEVRKTFDYHIWEDRIVNEAFELFLLFAYIQKKKIGHENVSNSFRYINEKTGFLREDAIEKILSELDITEQEWEKERDKLYRKHLEINGEGKKIRLICGKFLIHSLRCYLKQVYRINLGEKSRLEWSLIEYLETDSLRYIKDNIERLMA